jgi:hypothetical protein
VGLISIPHTGSRIIAQAITRFEIDKGSLFRTFLTAIDISNLPGLLRGRQREEGVAHRDTIRGIETECVISSRGERSWMIVERTPGLMFTSKRGNSLRPAVACDPRPKRITPHTTS